MKHLKMFGLLAVAAAAFMAFAASASATTVTGPGGNDTPLIHAESEEDAVPGTKHVLLHNESADIECNSTAEGDVETKNEHKVKGALDVLNFTSCTGGWVVHVKTRGNLEVTGIGNNKGTLFSSGATVEATLFGGLVRCRYKTETTHIGTVTGGTPATLHIEALIPFHGGSDLCGGEEAFWTGSYVTTGTVNIDS